MSERMLKIKEVMAITSFSHTEIYRRISAGTFPKQIKIGPGRSAWAASEVEAWVQEQITNARG